MRVTDFVSAPGSLHKQNKICEFIGMCNKGLLFNSRSSGFQSTNPTRTLRSHWETTLGRALSVHTLLPAAQGHWWGSGRGCCWRCDHKVLCWGYQHVLAALEHAQWLLLQPKAPVLMLWWLDRKGFHQHPYCGLSHIGCQAETLPHRNVHLELTLVPSLSRTTSSFQPWKHRDKLDISWIQHPVNV